MVHPAPGDGAADAGGREGLPRVFMAGEGSGAAGGGWAPRHAAPAPRDAPRLEVLDRISTGNFAATGRALGLRLAPGTERVRAPPPPSLSGVAGLGSGLRSGHAPAGGSPVHRGGVDLSFLRAHDVSL